MSCPVRVFLGGAAASSGRAEAVLAKNRRTWRRLVTVGATKVYRSSARRNAFEVDDARFALLRAEFHSWSDELGDSLHPMSD